MPMIYGLRDHERYVYHYTRVSVACDFILKDRTLRFSSFSRTNDPKESKDWEFNLATYRGRDLGAYKFQETSQWFSAALKSNAKLACFSLDRPPLTGDHTRDILNRGLAKPRMWAQYSENHTGVCLVFDKVKLLEAVKASFRSMLCLAGPVTYQNHYIVRSLKPHEFMIDVDLLETLGPKDYVGAHLQQHHKALFFEKLLDWRDESEWRIVLLADTDSDLYVPIHESLIGVIHGASIERKESDKVFALTESWIVEHMGLTWKNSSPWYDLGSFRWSASDRALLAKLGKNGA